VARGTIVKRKTRTKGGVFDIKYRTADGTQIKQAVGPIGKAVEVHRFWKLPGPAFRTDQVVRLRDDLPAVLALAVSLKRDLQLRFRISDELIAEAV